MKIEAKWSDDCCGKKDYDGDILSISTRYWPETGGFLVFDSNKPEKGLHPPDKLIKPSAHSSLILWHDGDSTTLIEAEFEGDTFEDVAKKVEIWAQNQFDRIIGALRTIFFESLNQKLVKS